MKDEKLVRISLQFFGEDEDLDEDLDNDQDEDLDDDFDDSVDDEIPEHWGEDDDDDLDDGDPDNNDDDDDQDDEDSEEKDDSAKDGADENSDTNTEGAEKKDEGGEQSETSALIAALKAAGYKGDDIKALTADIQKKNEDASAKAAAAERAAINKEGKEHVRSGKPSKNASGNGAAGVSERRVVAFAERAGCSREEARKLLYKHANLMS